MIEVVASVQKANDQHLWLKKNDGSQCQRCRQGNGCGGAIWGKLLSTNSLLRIPNDVQARDGDRLRLTISESRFVWISALAYFFPLVWLILAAGIGHYWYSEPGAIAAAVLAAGVWLVSMRGLLVSLTAARVFRGVQQERLSG